MLDGIANKMSNEQPDHTVVEEHKNTAEDRARMIQLLFANKTRGVANQNTAPPVTFETAANALAECAQPLNNVTFVAQLPPPTMHLILMMPLKW